MPTPFVASWHTVGRDGARVAPCRIRRSPDSRGAPALTTLFLLIFYMLFMLNIYRNR
jgi:hypothetical protein